jgi:hypothetical protein
MPAPIPIITAIPPIKITSDGEDCGVGVGTGAAIIVIATGVVCPEFTVTVVE